MPAFLESLEVRARERAARIAFPEAGDPRVLEATRRLAERGVATPVLVTTGASVPPPGVQIHDPDSDTSRFESLLRGTPWGADRTRGERTERVRDPLTRAALLLLGGEVDGVVAGAVASTADVLRVAIGVVGRDPAVASVSSAFYMVLPPRDGTPERVLTFTDAGVIPHPDPGQLAGIAAGAASARVAVVGDEPVVAFLSFSTHGSARSDSVERVREAVALFRRLRPDVAADGELQADAALVPDIRARKAPASPLAGSANVLVFPDLDAANIAYKLVERLAGATALGPILQGLSAPLNDLSRGATARDIFLVSCITALGQRPGGIHPSR